MSEFKACAIYNPTTGQWVTTPFGHAQTARVNARLASDPAALKVVVDRLVVILEEEK